MLWLRCLPSVVQEGVVGFPQTHTGTRRGRPPIALPEGFLGGERSASGQSCLCSQGPDGAQGVKAASGSSEGLLTQLSWIP